MKIAYLIPSLKKCGPVNVMSSLAIELAEEYDITVLALKSGDMLQSLTSAGITVKVVSIKAMLLDVISCDYDIVHSHCLIPDVMLGVASFFNKKSITCTTIHNFIDVDYIYSKGYVVGKLMGLFNRLALKKIKLRISCSEAVRDYCQRNYDIKSDAVCNGVYSQNGFNHTKISDKKHVDFYYLGVINARKNLEPLLCGFSLFLNKGNNDVLHIIGDGPSAEELRKKYEGDNIIFHGTSSDPVSLIENYDCYVSMSFAEGCPLAFLESLSLGKNYICSDIPPHREIHNKVRSGFLVSSSDLNSVIKAFENAIVIKDSQRENITNSFEQYFSVKVMSQKYKEVYNGKLKG